MSEESSTVSHLSVVMTTTEDNDTQTAGENSWANIHFYVVWAVVVIGVVGTAGNGLVLYALVASKQHKKNVLIVNQNALDLFSSFFSDRKLRSAAARQPICRSCWPLVVHNFDQWNLRLVGTRRFRSQPGLHHH